MNYFLLLENDFHAKMTKKTTKKRLSEVYHQANKTLEIHPKSRGKSYPKLKLAFFLGLISFIVYANTLKNGFTVDDVTVITENSIVHKGISAIPEILSTPYRRGYFITANDLYRPLSLVMFATEYQFFGNNPMPYHLVNILYFPFALFFFSIFYICFLGKKIIQLLLLQHYYLHCTPFIPK